MNYTNTIMGIRNDIHRDIIQEATVRNTVNGNESDGVLLLIKDVTINGKVISSICCETGYLLGQDNDKIVRYQDLTLEGLAVLHNYVVECKQYKFTLNSQLV
jgi:hypothetical protein